MESQSRTRKEKLCVCVCVNPQRLPVCSLDVSPHLVYNCNLVKGGHVFIAFILFVFHQTLGDWVTQVGFCDR